MASLNGFKAIIWASEKWMIEAALKVSPSLVLDEPEGREAIRSLAVDCHYKFDMSNDTPTLAGTKKLVPMVPTYYSNRKVIGFKGSAKARQINHGWAKSLSKAGKEWIGKTFKITSTFFKSTPEGNFHIVSGLTENGSRIHLFPNTMGEWDDYVDSIGDEDMKDNVYEILHRPRMTSSGDLRVGSLGIDLQSGYEYTSYIDCNNNSCTRAIAEEDLRKNSNGSCCVCDKQLTVDDNYRYIWYGYGALCSECDSNVELKNMMGIYQ
jgi:hypothetical protein